ncbi:Mucin-4 [Holothuria leucospilota]|uniref:Mucin-4 n=1 Tax=Holothuria leucospilota TaxID=206669 RepID=A0A9Q1C016_HOLLE|nr:Mucin-4 [Holothuria leucospilota]
MKTILLKVLTFSTVTCPPGQQACPDESCIPESYFCDLWPYDCSDNYDESVEAGCAECSELEYRCPEGLCIPNEWICDDYPYDCANNYDESDILCNGTCTSVMPPDNGFENGTFKYRYQNGDSASFACLSGYTLVGEAVIVCNMGNFSDPVPTCYANCQAPQAPVNGQFSGSLLHGGSISFTCDAGYEIQSGLSSTLYCIDGEFNGSVPICQETDECLSSPCFNDGTCVDLINMFQCVCDDGWTGVLCEEDFDECFNSSLNDCHQNASCTNTDGFYHCTCNEGFRGDGLTCREIFFFPFGDEVGDSRLRDNFDYSDTQFTEYISPTIRPSAGFPFWGEFFYGLYFTENGVLLFIRENEEKYGYPHPFQDGFNSGHNERIVAPFWADADLSTSQGEVYYQVYDGVGNNISSVKSALLAEASSRINSYDDTLASLNVTFNANWMLVVTWREIPAYKAEFVGNASNTFQLVLATDGTFGFSLFNYREDEMLWNTDLIYNKDAIIGYNSGLWYQNAHEESPFTDQNSKYRPDQLIGNTGLKGRWFFRLENNTIETINYKQMCYDWYYQQPDPSTWDRTLGTCACGFDQGRNDNSYARRGRPSVSNTNLRRIPRNILDDIDDMEGLLINITSLSIINVCTTYTFAF